MKKKILIACGIVTIISLSIGGYFYYETKYKPTSFVNSFFEELEFKGTMDVDGKYFISDLDLRFVKPWDEYLREHLKSGVSEKAIFTVWKKVYLSNLEDYILLDGKNFNSALMLYEHFKKTYSTMEFSEIKLEIVEIKNNILTAYGHANVKAKNHITNFVVGGERRIKLIALNGKLGWKILGFAIMDI